MCSSTLPLYCICRNITTIEPVQLSPSAEGHVADKLHSIVWTKIYSDLFAFIVIKSHAPHFHVALKESQNNLH